VPKFFIFLGLFVKFAHFLSFFQRTSTYFKLVSEAHFSQTRKSLEQTNKSFVSTYYGLKGWVLQKLIWVLFSDPTSL